MLSSKKCSFISNLIDHLNFITWAMKNWCFPTVVLRTTPKSPLDSKEIKPVNLKGNQHCILIERIDDVAEAATLWPPDVRRWLIGKDPVAGKDWRQKEKIVTEDEMVRWHHRFNGTWTWANSGRWWGTEKPGMLQSLRSWRVGHD